MVSRSSDWGIVVSASVGAAVVGTVVVSWHVTNLAFNTNVKVKTSPILGFKSMVLITAFNTAIFWFVRLRQSINAFLAYLKLH